MRLSQKECNTGVATDGQKPWNATALKPWLKPWFMGIYGRIEPFRASERWCRISFSLTVCLICSPTTALSTMPRIPLVLSNKQWSRAVGGAGWLAEAPFRQVSPPASASPPHRWTVGGYSPALPSSFSKWLSSPASQIARRLIPLSVTAMYRYTRKPELYLEEKHPVTSENSLPSSPFFCIDRFSCNQPVWTGLVLANPLRATGIVGYCFMAPFSQSASYSSGLPTGCSTCF